LKEFKNIIPTYMVKSRPNFELEEEGRFFPTAKPPSVVTGKHDEAVMEVSKLDEYTLDMGENIVHSRGQTMR
jgi:hypothetical protein